MEHMKNDSEELLRKVRIRSSLVKASQVTMPARNDAPANKKPNIMPRRRLEVVGFTTKNDKVPPIIPLKNR